MLRRKPNKIKKLPEGLELFRVDLEDGRRAECRARTKKQAAAAAAAIWAIPPEYLLEHAQIRRVV